MASTSSNAVVNIVKRDDSVEDVRIQFERVFSFQVPNCHEPDSAVARATPASTPWSMKSLGGEGFQMIKVQASRIVDPSDYKRIHYDRVAAIFHESMRTAIKYKIDSIELVCNPILEEAFEAKKREFHADGIPSHEVLAFHGTPVGNVLNICQTNLQYLTHAKRQVYGPGNYFSEFPDVSIPYGQLMLFRVLPGKEYENENSGDIPNGINTKKVKGDPKGFGEMLVIKDPNQFLPYAVYNLSQ